MTVPRVFVSHATSDSTFANNFSQDLRQLGADVWLDSSHLGAGDFVARINDALQRSDVFILVLTPAALASPWVQQEMNAAIAREKQGMLRALFVVMAQHCPLGAIPPLWTVYNRYDANNDYYSAALYGVAEKMGLRVPGLQATASAPQPPLPQRLSLPKPASLGGRPAHLWIFGSATLATVLGIITLVYELLNLTQSNYPIPLTSAFGMAIVLPEVLVTVLAWISTLRLTLRTQSRRWGFAVTVSIGLSIMLAFGSIGLFAVAAWNMSQLGTQFIAFIHIVSYILIDICLIVSLLLPIRIGLVGLGPKREK